MSIDRQIDELLGSAARAGIPPADLLSSLLRALGSQRSITADTGATRLDLDRARRCGHPEVIYAAGKTADELALLVRRLIDAGQDVLATRVSPPQAAAVLAASPAAIWNESARTLRQMHPDRAAPDTGRVVVVTAGTSDRPVAEEALETLAWMRVGRELITDVGVAGPWRLLEQLPRLQSADAVIVAAGMEGALPSVVGGWVACPVLAVPTSVGYGAAFHGLTALLGMLNSCAANVTVVNIDAGFKAGYIAGLIAAPRTTPGRRD